MSAIADTPPRHAAGSNRWLVTMTSLTASISVTLSATIVNVAIPDIMGTFGMGQITAQWMSTAFLASMTATMLMTDWLDKVLGLRATFVVALSIFVLGSVIGGIAPNEDFLILSRIMQGGAAGIVQPLSMVAMFRVFPPEQRGNAMGIFGLGVVLGPTVGVAVGVFVGAPVGAPARASRAPRQAPKEGFGAGMEAAPSRACCSTHAPPLARVAPPPLRVGCN